MPPFHSTLSHNGKSFGNFALMPLKQTSKGSARGPAPVTNEEDIVDQAIQLFKVNNLSHHHSQDSSAGQHSVQIIRHGDGGGQGPGLPDPLHHRVSQETAEVLQPGESISGMDS